MDFKRKTILRIKLSVLYVNFKDGDQTRRAFQVENKFKTFKLHHNKLNKPQTLPSAPENNFKDVSALHADNMLAWS